MYLLPNLNRSYVTTNGIHHYSPESRRLLDFKEIVSVLEDETDILVAERNHSVFQAKTHTYTYTLPGGAQASSRLTLWYVSVRVSDWIGDISMAVPGSNSDHSKINVRIAAPKTVVQHFKSRHLYPVAAVVHATVKTTIINAITSASRTLEAVLNFLMTDVSTANNLTQWWDECKVGLPRAVLNDSRTIRQKRTNSYR